MKIEFWCDIICPFCGLAQHRLENALAAFEHGAEVQVVHRSFQLHPVLNGVAQRELLVTRVPNPDEVEKTVLRPLEQAAEREGDDGIFRPNPPMSEGTTGMLDELAKWTLALKSMRPDAAT